MYEQNVVENIKDKRIEYVLCGMYLQVTDQHEMMLPTNWKYRHPMCASWFMDILERLDYGNRFLKCAVFAHAAIFHASGRVNCSNIWILGSD
jgi:hypothetical protein